MEESNERSKEWSIEWSKERSKEWSKKWSKVSSAPGDLGEPLERHDAGLLGHVPQRPGLARPGVTVGLGIRKVHLQTGRGRGG
jgi:hypothetical protein